MLRYLGRRIVLMAITLFVVASATWGLSKTLPGTPFADQKLTPEVRERLFEKYGLDEPLPVQYFKYMSNLVRGDLGTSFYYNNQPVMDIIMDGLPVSAFIGLQAAIIGVSVGLVLGVAAALKHNSLLDTSATTAAVVGISVPSFVLAPLLQYFVAFKWGLLPIAFWESYLHSILPSLSLAVFVIAVVARFVRAEMLEVLGQDYITLATSKGLSKLKVILRHVLRNSMIPMVTILPPLIVALLTGSLVIEVIYAIPGIGQLLLTGITVSDYSMIIGVTLLLAFLFVVSLLVSDILYTVIDPRIRISGGGS